jgi:hypothetical protein
MQENDKLRTSVIPLITCRSWARREWEMGGVEGVSS